MPTDWSVQAATPAWLDKATVKAMRWFVERYVCKAYADGYQRETRGFFQLRQVQGRPFGVTEMSLMQGGCWGEDDIFGRSGGVRV